ncbi:MULTISPECIES: DUF5802 family protein [Saliphagus]|uniref:DUF5802 family protein n=1 Tax=Saliphagus infecundisoli TaxID=1849069 RepID=A0ABD5QF47_9EURY|nr:MULTISPECIES: DUF5802 family protein [Saliphagus]
MFEAFSGGYYLGRLYVTPTDGDRVLMDDGQHERVNRELYATGEGVEPLDTPVVMKLDATHFRVHGDEAVPANTLEIPEALLEDSRIRNPPQLREVLLARRERARQLVAYGAG